MKIVVVALGLIALLVTMSVATLQGLDLRKRSSWLYGAFGFLCGFVLSFLLIGNLIESLKGGGAFALLILANGAAMRWHKQRYQGK